MAEHPLRDLARQIEALAKEHPAYSQAQPIVQHCIDYLCAVARCHECNATIASLGEFLAAQKMGDKTL